jgi:predicted neuraminidase
LGASAGPRGEFIFDPLMPPTPQCHASTIAERPDGALVAAWFGGSGEGRPDVGIWISRFEAGRWTAPIEAADGLTPAPGGGEAIRHPCWNPVLYQPEGGALILFYKVGPSPSAWWGMLKRSGDGGRTWSEPRRLPDGFLGPIKNKPVRGPGGEILCGSSREERGWRVHFEWTADQGRTWGKTGDLDADGGIEAIQPSLLVHPGGRLQSLGRSRQGRIWESWSGDGGRTWSRLRLTGLPNPNSGTDAVTLHDGRHILVYNASEKERTPLNVAVSEDGRSWSMVLTLETEPGEFSYPAVIQAADGLVHATYTWKRRAIRHVVLDPRDLR